MFFLLVVVRQHSDRCYYYAIKPYPDPQRGGAWVQLKGARVERRQPLRRLLPLREREVLHPHAHVALELADRALEDEEDVLRVRKVRGRSLHEVQAFLPQLAERVDLELVLNVP